MGADRELERRKRELRRIVRDARAALPDGERRTRSRQVADHLRRLDEVLGASTVAAYVATPREVDVDDLLRELLAGGATLLLPWVDGARVHLAQVTDLDADLVAGYRGVREPRAALRRPVDPSAADVVLVPGVAFDVSGRRLGAGGGHLDRLLAEVGPRPLRIGLAFGVQVVDEVPTQPHDAPVDLVVTEAGVVDARRS